MPVYKFIKNSLNLRFFSVSLIILSCGFSSLSCFRPTSRHLPFWTELDRVTEADSGFSVSLFSTEASFEYLEKDSEANKTKPFDGIEINLKNLDQAYNQYNLDSGLPAKSYLSGSGAYGLARYKNEDLILESFVDTWVHGAEFAWHKKWDGLFDSSIEKVGFKNSIESGLRGLQFFVGAQMPLMVGFRNAEYHPDFQTRKNNNILRQRGTINYNRNDSMIMALQGFAADANLKIHKWSKAGFGDLNLYAGIGKKFNYVLRCTSMDFAAAFGMTLPTGEKFDLDSPLSFSFGREGVSFHANLMANVELQRGMFVGTNLEFCSGAKSTGQRRLPVKAEAGGFSPLVAETELKSGKMMRFSPYVSLKNFMDWWLDCTAGYSYITAARSEWTDLRKDQTVRSFLNNGDAASMHARQDASAWNARYFNLKFVFDPESYNSSWKYRPVMWFAYDHPLSREADVLHKKFALGMSIKF